MTDYLKMGQFGTSAEPGWIGGLRMDLAETASAYNQADAVVRAMLCPTVQLRVTAPSSQFLSADLSVDDLEIAAEMERRAPPVALYSSPVEQDYGCRVYW